MKGCLRYIVGAMLLMSFGGTKPTGEFPQAQISNGIVQARLYLPDDKEGYYRGTRFDWSGVMPALEYNGHTYFGQWVPKYSPTLHDAIMGPVEDFYPVGYDDAKTGEVFLKIGIGMVVKPEEAKYFFANSYQLANAGEWKVKKKSDQVEFVHRLEDKDYAYEYRKTVELVKGKPEMILSHRLKNTGKKNLSSAVYNHNFFVMDNQPIGPDFVVTFPFTPSGDAETTRTYGHLEGNQIIYAKALGDNGHLQFKSLQGYGDSGKDYDIRIENHKTGAAVRITCDKPLTQLAFWSAPKTICPEPFIQVDVKPGDTFAWKIKYQFYTCDITSD
ncbi:MAG TPA: hypothetical protein VFW11_13495 [Cyclobacteriaceae bacterium]|nr:hypothetical protein [Cyclobacteriaceae bacterium]